MKKLVYLKNDEAVCDSLQVAEKFSKRHDNVMQAIRGLLKIKESSQMFTPTHYTNEQNRKMPMYLMNRDGFSLLAMGFTGKKALEWKLQYIQAFNKMESILKERSTQAWLQTRQQGKLTRKFETDTIKQLVEYAKAQGSEHSDKLYMTYSKLANKAAGINKRDEATVMQLNQLTMIEHIILTQIRIGMEQELAYKEIYQACKKQLEMFQSVAYLGAFKN